MLKNLIAKAVQGLLGQEQGQRLQRAAMVPVRRLRLELHTALAHRKPASQRTLVDLAAIHRSDKGLHFGQRHGYAVVYDELFGPERQRDLTMVEIGLRHDPYYASTRQISPSLSMWRDYFPRAKIFGFDIKRFESHGDPRVQVLQGDQGDVADLKRLAAAFGSADFIIDDGSHASMHQRTSFETLFPYVKPGGAYLIEDLHYQPLELEQSLPPTPLMRTLLQDEAYLARFGLRREQVRFCCGDKLAVIKRV